MEQLGKKVVSCGIYNYLGQFVSAPLFLIASIYIVRSLKVEDYGLYGILINISHSFLLISFVGMPNIIQRYLPELIESNNYYMAKRIIKTAFIIPVFSVTILIILFILFSDGISRILNAQALPRYFPVFTLYIIMVLCVGISTAVINALLEQRYKNITNILYAILYLLFVFLALRFGFGLFGLILAIAVANLFFWGALQYKIYRAVFKRSEGKGINIFKRAARYGFYYYFSSLSGIILDATSDIFLISFFLGTTASGYYLFAYKQSKAILRFMPVTVFMNVLIPAFIRYYTRDKKEDSLSFVFRLTNKLTVFFVLPVVVWTILLSRQIIIYVFDVKYLPANYVFIVWLLIGMIYALIEPLKIVLVTTEKVNIFLYERIFAIYNIVGDIVLIPRFGIMGAAIATGTSAFFSYLMVVWYAKKRINRLEYPWRSLVSIAINTSISAIVIIPAKGLISNIYGLLCVMFLGVLVYLASALINRSFTETEREIFKKSIPLKVLNHISF